MRGWIFLLAVAGTALTVLGHARAQDLGDGWSRLDDKFRSVGARVRGFLSGSDRVDPNDMSQVEAIDVLAKTYTWGIYLRKFDTEKDGIKKEYDAFDKDIDKILKSKDRDAMQPLAEVLRDKVRVHALEVIQLKEARPIHKIYNARVLDKIAELGQPALAGTLITILQDSQQNDAVRYYTLEAMGTLLSQVQPGQGDPMLSKDQQSKCAEALIAFLEQKKGPDKNAPVEEIDGFRLLRREAVRTLAKIHTPAFSDKVRPALVLARFAGNDERIQPPPRIDERVEAAMGLARMVQGRDNRYQPDYAAGQIAKCLGAFAFAAQNERNNQKEVKTHPWRVQAALLKEALETMKKNYEKNDYVARLADRGVGLVGKTIASSTIDPNELTWWRSQQSDPAHKELFQGSPDSTVKPAPEGEESAEK
jgi:hypothetical protein